ncbi:hypothetical protein B0H12DRAFT_1161197, partial [Mycena haematopus]
MLSGSTQSQPLRQHSFPTLRPPLRHRLPVHYNLDPLHLPLCPADCSHRSPPCLSLHAMHTSPHCTVTSPSCGGVPPAPRGL